jgi:hypothetical protein
MTCDIGFDIMFDETTGNEYCDYYTGPECDYGFYMGYNDISMQDECMPCLQDCEFCYDSYSCDLCYSGFEVVVTQDPNSSDLIYTCEQSTTPQTCDIGLYFDEYMNQCELCADGCMDCS